jgi:hypothetical protein
MSLSTQLTRGTLALPMLVLFGVLALVSNEPVDASLPEPQTANQAHASNELPELTSVAGRKLVLEARNADAGCSVHARPAALIAPAELGLAPRSCRAAG